MFFYTILATVLIKLWTPDKVLIRVPGGKAQITYLSYLYSQYFCEPKENSSSKYAQYVVTCEVRSRKTRSVSDSESACSTCAGVAAAEASGAGEPSTRTCRTRTAGSGPRSSHRTRTDVLEPPATRSLSAHTLNSTVTHLLLAEREIYIHNQCWAVKVERDSDDEMFVTVCIGIS